MEEEKCIKEESKESRELKKDKWSKRKNGGEHQKRPQSKEVGKEKTNVAGDHCQKEEKQAIKTVTCSNALLLRSKGIIQPVASSGRFTFPHALFIRHCLFKTKRLSFRRAEKTIVPSDFNHAFTIVTVAATRKTSSSFLFILNCSIYLYLGVA